MATSQSIRDEFQALSDSVLELETFAKISDSLIGDNPDAPQWPWFLSQQVDRINEAMEALECTLRTKAIPLMEDMDRLAKA